MEYSRFIFYNYFRRVPLRMIIEDLIEGDREGILKEDEGEEGEVVVGEQATGRIVEEEVEQEVVAVVVTGTKTMLGK